MKTLMVSLDVLLIQQSRAIQRVLYLLFNLLLLCSWSSQNMIKQVVFTKTVLWNQRPQLKAKYFWIMSFFMFSIIIYIFPFFLHFQPSKSPVCSACAAGAAAASAGFRWPSRPRVCSASPARPRNKMDNFIRKINKVFRKIHNFLQKSKKILRKYIIS